MIITGKKFSKPAMSRVINGDVAIKTAEQKPEKFRLDHLLAQQHPEYNRSTLQKLIREGRVTVDGTIVQKPNAQLAASATITLSAPARTPLTPDLTPTILYEDAHVKVVSKPAGLLSMTKGDFCPEPTLEDFGLLVHRLDRDTSGVVILAKDPTTQSFLRRQFQERRAHKTYYAIVQGRPKLSAAKIDLPLSRNLARPATFRVDPNGRASITYYKVLATTGSLSLLELRPVTGRTHQLRVHLQYLGTPILGDRVYGSTLTDQTTSPTTDQAAHSATNPAAISATRLMLHAYSLEITIPSQSASSPNERKVFTAPLPADFTKLFPDAASLLATPAKATQETAQEVSQETTA